MPGRFLSRSNRRFGDVMTGNEPESANRWATEHYGFVQDPVRGDAGAEGLPAPSARPTPSSHGGSRPSRRTGLIASAVLSLALVAGIGGAAVGSDAGPDGGRHGTTRLDGGAGRGDLAPRGHRGAHS